MLAASNRAKTSMSPVRPLAWYIIPEADNSTVLLQAMKQEPPADAKCRDKFLVQSASITGDKEFASIASVVRITRPHAGRTLTDEV